ncbi:hypothetical protein GLYMA_02G055701v4 [Glycine max]|nr:hypothetical protein GLYMA_02G055701v4 [Glycine max]
MFCFLRVELWILLSMSHLKVTTNKIDSKPCSSMASSLVEMVIF